MIRFPEPLRPGDRIGVTSSSRGVPSRLRGRLDIAVQWLRDRGHEVEVGECLADDAGHVSAPVEKRAAELNRMLLDPKIRVVLPPWGGETAIDLLDHLDWDALAAAEPTWLVGYSDLSTVMLPLTLRLGWATLHGANLMETPYDPARGLLHWTDVAAANGPLTQYAVDASGHWEVAGGGGVDVTGRLVGGCIETISNLTGTPYGDVPAFGRQHAEDGLLVYVEAAEAPALEICRKLHGLRLAGWFDEAEAVLVGRTRAPASGDFSQRDAVLDALGMLDLPIVLDVDFGHVPPQLPLVNGALAHVSVTGSEQRIVQEFV